MVKNGIFELQIDDLDCEGMGIGHLDGYTIFVKNALPGEIVKVKALKVTKTICFAKTLEIITRSNERVEPKCPYYSLCGGCNMMHMTYEAELKYKLNSFKNTLKKMGIDKEVDIIKSDNEYNYRNKISLPVGYDDEAETFITGFYQERSHNIIASKGCLIENKNASVVTQYIISMLNESKIYPYDELTNTGDLRHIMLRVASSGKYMVTLVFRENSKKVRDFANSLEHNLITSVYININPKQTNVILGEEFHLISGTEFLTEDLFGNKFEIHPNSFFQVNYKQMLKLYTCAIEKLNPTKEMNVIDAYSGIGTITLSLANKCKKVYGIEVVKEAVDNANKNAKKNNIDNVEFILGPCEEMITDLVKKEKIDAIMMDPPRKGSDQKFLDTVINAKIPRIVYISCGPAALARDLKYLSDYYTIESITACDMFSRTSNLESVTLLCRKGE